MNELLLISSRWSHFFDELRSWLPPSVSLISVGTFKEAQQKLQNTQNLPLFILADAGAAGELSAICREVNELKRRWIAPVVAILSNPSDREAVLQAGADSYLLLPLLQEEVLACLSQYMRLKELSKDQEEAQVQAAQMAHLLLIIRLIDERPDLRIILSRSLEQIVGLFNAFGGDIWLISEDVEYLELVSSLFPGTSPLGRISRCDRGHGLIGWVVDQEEPLVVNIPAEDPRFDPQIDQPGASALDLGMLAVPLRFGGKNIGVLTLYKKGIPFNTWETTLLEIIIPLIAAAIVNAQTLKTMNHAIERQHVLYEMSQQITVGLDVHATLNRAARWIGRLVDVELVLIWLADEKEQVLEAAAALGIDLPEESIRIPADNIPHMAQPVIDQLGDNPYLVALFNQILKIKPLNILLLPMMQEGQLLGMVSLNNKVGGAFTGEELALLTSATEMIAVSLNNALLHARLLALLDERERLHQQALKNERLRIIGLLTASLAHEINNPMQAIHGALALALEELENPATMIELLRLGQQEVNRVVKLVNRMRLLYRPASEKPEVVHISSTLREILEIVKNEMLSQGIRVRISAMPDPLVIVGVTSQLYLGFLSILLHLSSVISEAGGSELCIAAQSAQDAVWVEFSTNVPFAQVFRDGGAVDIAVEGGSRIPDELSLTADILAANGGRMEFLHQKNQSVLRVVLPSIS